MNISPRVSKRIPYPMRGSEFAFLTEVGMKTFRETFSEAAPRILFHNVRL